MMTKKISADTFNYIWEPNTSHRKLDWSRTYTMTKYNNGGYYFVESVKIWLFILLYIPATILTFLDCLWDGGLIEFRFPDMPKSIWRLDIYDKPYMEEYFQRAEKVWERG